MLLGHLLILLFLLVIYPATYHLYQRARWNDPDCSLPMFLRNRSCMLFFTWKVFNKRFTICVQLYRHFPSIKVFYHTVCHDKYRFSVLFSFCLSFLWSCAVIFYCGLQPLTIQWSYDCHVLVGLSRYISLLFFYLAFFFFIAEASWSVCILACSRWFLCFLVVIISFFFRSF